jgi:hypothetical protein
VNGRKRAVIVVGAVNVTVQTLVRPQVAPDQPAKTVSASHAAFSVRTVPLV